MRSKVFGLSSSFDKSPEESHLLKKIALCVKSVISIVTHDEAFLVTCFSYWYECPADTLDGTKYQSPSRKQIKEKAALDWNKCLALNK